MISLRPIGFRARLTLRWTLVFSALLAVVSLWIYAGIRTAFYAYLDKQLRTLAATEVTSAVDTPTSLPRLHDLPVRVLAGGMFAQKMVQVFDDRGVMVAASPEGTGRARLADAAEIAGGLSGEAPVHTVIATGTPYRVVVLHASADGRDYAMAVGVGMSDLLNSLADVKWLLILVWIVSTGATGAVGYTLASTALAPVRRMTQRAVEIAKTDIRARLEPSPVQDEIGQMTQALNTLIERLHVALDANRRFAADAAHELRSPVTAITGEIQVALRRERSAAEYRETLLLVQSRLAVLSAIIRDLMLLVRAQESGNVVRHQEVSLDTTVHASVERFRALAASSHVSVSVGGLDGLLTYAEPGLLARVFDNVLENAIRYNPEGGAVVIDGFFSESPGGEWTPGTVTVRIADTGPGISEPERERVFERFYRVDHSRSRFTGGSGLGLAIAREVLALFNGVIRVERSSPEGTVIAVQIPGQQRATVRTGSGGGISPAA